MNDELSVWWVSEEDCKRIGEPVYDQDLDDLLENNEGKRPAWSVLMSELAMPDYVKKQYSSRYGRAGRGRLWVPDGIELPGGVPWGSGPVYDRAIKCGGIVFRNQDLEEMMKLPGFITDTRMNIIEREGLDPKKCRRCGEKMSMAEAVQSNLCWACRSS